MKPGLYCSSARRVTHVRLGSLPAVKGTSSDHITSLQSCSRYSSTHPSLFQRPASVTLRTFRQDVDEARPQRLSCGWWLQSIPVDLQALETSFSGWHRSLLGSCRVLQADACVDDLEDGSETFDGRRCKSCIRGQWTSNQHFSTGSAHYSYHPLTLF